MGTEYLGIDVTLTLHLGVIDIPYARAAQAATSRKPGPRPGPGKSGALSTNTTGDVAQILEAHYGIMQKFFDLYGDRIATALTEVMQDRLEEVLMGHPREQLFNDADFGEIEQHFKKMLDTQELDGQISGVPTGASLRGVNHRLKRPYAKRSPRPSFIDTGLYQSSFKAWID